MNSPASSAALHPAATAKLDVLHKGKSKVVNLTLGQLPNTQEAKADIDADRKGSTQGFEVPRLGMTVAPADKVDGAGKKASLSRKWTRRARPRIAVSRRAT